MDHTLTQMRDAFAASEAQAGHNSDSGILPGFESGNHAAVRLTASEASALGIDPLSDAESGELLLPTQGSGEKGCSGGGVESPEAVEGVGKRLKGNGAPHNRDLDRNYEQGKNPGVDEKRVSRNEGSDRSKSRERGETERKMASRREEEAKEGGKSKRQKHKSFSGEQSLPSSGHRRRKDRQETVSSDSGSDKANNSKRHRYESGSYVGHRVTSAPIVSSPQVSDALRARVRAMLQSVAPK